MTNLECDFMEIPDLPPIQRKTVYLQSSAKKYDKQHACIFCGKLICKIARHLQLAHGSEPEIVRVLSLQKGSDERKNLLANLRNRGDFKHNYDVLEKGKGFIIPKMRPRKRLSGNSTRNSFNNYVACQYCKAMFVATDIRTHAKKCNKSKDASTLKRREAIIQGRMILPIPKDINPEFYKAILLTMRDDELSKIARNDYLILNYGKQRYFRMDIKQHTHNRISTKMRQLARLVLTGQKKYSDMESLSDYINPVNFMKMVDCVKSMAEYNPITQKYKTPNLALLLGNCLNDVAKHCKHPGTTEHGNERCKNCDRFGELYNAHWNEYVSGIALSSTRHHQSNYDKWVLSENVTRKQPERVRKKLRTSQNMDGKSIINVVLLETQLFTI